MGSSVVDTVAVPRFAELDFEALAPDAHRAMRSLESALWLEPRVRELVEIRTAQLNGAPGSLVRHAREALALGETQSRLAALARWRTSLLFGEDEKAALGLAEALAAATHPNAISLARVHAAKHFGPAELAELVFACAVANAWDRLELAGGAQRP